MVDVTPEKIEHIGPAEVPEVDLYHAKSWWTKYVFSQLSEVVNSGWRISLSRTCVTSSSAE